MLQKQVLSIPIFCLFIALAIASCAKGRLESAGSMCGMLRATKDINPGESISKEDFKETIEKFKPGENIPDVVTAEEVLVELKPIEKISKDDFFYCVYFDEEELENKRQEFYERNKKEFENLKKSSVRE